MHDLDGIEVAAAIARVRSHARDPRTKDAICRLAWILCVAFGDEKAVQDAFEDAYDALTDAGNQIAQQFEAASSDLENAYDAWLAATLAIVEEAPDRSPEWGMASRGSVKSPYLFLQSNERTAG